MATLTSTTGTLVWAALLIGPTGIGCGGGASSAPPARSSTEQAAEERKGPTVYDALGNEVTCRPPQRDCPAVTPNRGFLDACQLGGFQLVKCGCETYCMGKVDTRVYDANGTAKPCAPIDESCAPAPASAAFQDACAERGHRLEQCGCEWACSGDPTK